MALDPLSDARIIDSWVRNAEPWTTAVRSGRIESRRLVTYRAIVEAVLARSPRSVLDIGCGEGWLARALAARQVHVTGIDAVPALVQQAQKAGFGDFRVMSYEGLAAGALRIQVDVAVCNFSLLGERSVEDLLRAVPPLLTPTGTFIVQTLHPLIACGEQPYRDGWRAGSWSGFSNDFTDPAPWYFRTLESWVAMFARSGWQIRSTLEPLDPRTLRPASVIFIATR